MIVSGHDNWIMKWTRYYISKRETAVNALKSKELVRQDREGVEGRIYADEKNINTSVIKSSVIKKVERRSVGMHSH